MTIGRRRPLFRPRARVIGKVEWLCPFCGTINKSSLPPLAYRLQCTHRDCRRKFLVGLRLYEMPGGGQMRMPPDMIIPHEEAFPEATIAPRRYRVGDPVHELVQDD